MTWALAGCGGGGSGGGDSTTPTPVPSPDTGRAGADYFPLGAGDRWTYLQGETQVSRRVQGTRTVDGQVVTVVASSDPDDAGELYLQKSAAAVVELPSPDAPALVKALGPVTRYRLPLVAGDRYTTVDRSFAAFADLDGDGRADDVTLKVDVEVLGFESLDLPVGRFTQVARVKTSFSFTVRASRNGQSVTDVSTSEDWLAPDVGVVRSVLRDPGDGVPVETQQVIYRYRTGSTRAESVAPTIVSTSPAALTPVQLFSSVVDIRFSEDMDRQAAVPGLTITSAAGSVLQGRSFWMDATTLRYAIDGGLATGTYTVAVPGSFEDLSGNALAASSWTLTIDRSSPVVAAADPANGATGVATGGAIRITMDEAFQAQWVTASLTWRENAVAADVSVSGRVLTLQPREPLLFGATYQWSLGGLVDALGNQSSTDSVPARGSFTTEAGRFRLPLEAPVPQRRVMAAHSSDLNGDGRPDWLFATAAGSVPWATEVQVLTASADGGWSAPVGVVGSGCSIEGLTSGDFNGDGRADWAMVTGCGTDVLLQDVAGGFRAVTVSATGERTTYWPRALRQAGHTQPALLQAERLGALQPNKLRAWRWDGVSGFTPGDFLGHGLWSIRDVAVADLNGDGLDDIVVTGEATPGELAAVVLRQAGDGSFAAPAELMRGGIGAMPVDITVVDFDRDGRLDIVLTGGSQPAAALLLAQQAGGQLASARALSMDGQRLERVRLADVDGDGRLDLVGFGILRDMLGVSLQRADGTFAAPERFEASSGADFNFWLGDWNADGRPDVLVETGWLVQRGTTPSGMGRAVQALWRAAGARAAPGAAGPR